MILLHCCQIGIMRLVNSLAKNTVTDFYSRWFSLVPMMDKKPLNELYELSHRCFHQEQGHRCS